MEPVLSRRLVKKLTACWESRSLVGEENRNRQESTLKEVVGDVFFIERRERIGVVR